MDGTKDTPMTTYTDNVLLVDDNELLLQMMKRTLTKDFGHVEAVCNGEEAILNLRNQPYNMVVLDINLPGIDGWAVFDFIKHHCPESKVVIISCDGCEIEEDALSKGAVAVLEKPFGLEELRRICRQELTGPHVRAVPDNGRHQFGRVDVIPKAAPENLL